MERGVWYTESMKHLIDCACGREKCDLVIKNVNIFHVFTGEVTRGSVGVADGRIVGVGDYAGKTEYDGKGQYLLPSFLDAHIHVESSLLSPEAFAVLAVKNGTGTIVADPHEIVNVCGIGGAEYIKEAFSRLVVDGVQPLDVLLQLPSCVPATPFETSGANIGGEETERQIGRDLFYGLGEMMNFSAVVGADGDVLKKIAAALGQGKIVDGHAPELSGKELNAYLCAGISTDHECVTAEEFAEKVRGGMYAQIRVGSSTNSVEAGVKAVTETNFRRFLVCSDDKHAEDLERGHIGAALARLVKAGLPAKFAIPMSTLNVAECYHVKDVGAIAPHYFADMVLVKDLEEFAVSAVWKRGVLVAEEGKALFDGTKRYLPATVLDTVHVKDVSPKDFAIMAHGGRLRAISMTPQSLCTDEEFTPPLEGEIDIKGTEFLKLAVVERHFATGRIGLGLVKGFGLKGGAIGITVAHDSHNLIVMGDDDRAMANVVGLLRKAGGGMALVSAAEEDVFPLDIAGLMSSAPHEEVVQRTAQLRAKAFGMGVREGFDPFMSLAFLALPVIPRLKLTDRGLFDLGKGCFVPLEEEKNV